MTTVGVHPAKSTLSQLLRRVEAGEEIIMRGGTPVARLVAVAPAQKRRLGMDRDRLRIPADFDAPLDDQA